MLSGLGIKPISLKSVQFPQLLQVFSLQIKCNWFLPTTVLNLINYSIREALFNIDSMLPNSNLILSMLGKNFSRGHFKYFYSHIFPRKYWPFKETICMKSSSLFSWKNIKYMYIINLSSDEFAQKRGKG